jgi:pilus assembly protein CpaE
MSLPAVLVGEPTQMREVRRRFEDLSIHIEHDFANLGQCLKSIQPQTDYTRMFAVHVTANDLPQLERAAAQHAGHPFVAIIDEPAPSESLRFGMPVLVHGAMRAGACQVLTRPVDSADLTAVLACLNRQYGAADQRHTLIAVTGATGGSGATTLAVNLAYELSRLTERHCILTEQEGRVGMLASYLDLQPKHTYADLASMDEWDQNAVQQTMVECHGGVRVLCGGPAMGGDQPRSENLTPVLNTLRSMAPFVVVDVACTLTPAYFEILSQADHIFIVAEQTLPSMRNLRLLQESLRPLEKSTATNVVVNKFDPRVSGFSLAGIKDIVATPNVWTVESAASVVNGALNTGRPLRLHAERAPVVEDITKIARSAASAAGHTELKEAKAAAGLFGFLRLRA